MIFFLVTKEYSFPITTYLDTWGKELAGRIRLLPYEDLPKLKKLETGTYIFADIERLNSFQAEKSVHTLDHLNNGKSKIRLLNHPTYSMRRYELLRNLYELGLNRFNTYRLTEARMPQRFPVFIRGENDHNSAITPLIPNSEELIKVIKDILRQKISRENKLITEYCDTSDERGMFRKYSAFIVGDRVIPRHLFFSKNWVIKGPVIHNDKLYKEEWNYLKMNPHKKQLKEIFRLARIDYGRIDYGILDGNIQVWEINTNPFVMMPPEQYHPERMAAQDFFSQQLKSAFDSIYS